MLLHGYFRSSAAYRVRIALGLKGLAFDQQAVHLLRNGGEQHSAAYRQVNPEELVPALQDGPHTLSQSLAILEYLEETHPGTPLLPRAPADRAWVRALAALVACDIHPVNNLRVMQYLEQRLGATAEQKSAWTAHWIQVGFTAIEARLAHDGRSGLCCFGDTPGLADCCLVPQIFNARRFAVPMDAFPTIVRIEAHLAGLEAFQRAAPEAQPDAQ